MSNSYKTNLDVFAVLACQFEVFNYDRKVGYADNV